jgi:hypothetical protein
MIEIQVTPELRYRVVYRMDGVICSVFECAELTTAVKEVQQKMRLVMGLHKGLSFQTHNGKEI